MPMRVEQLRSPPVGSANSALWSVLPWLALAALALPAGLVIRSLALEVWAVETANYGPVVLVACGWLLLSRVREQLGHDIRPAWAFAFALILLAFPFFLVGQILEILLFQVVAFVLLVAAYISAYVGRKALTRCILPLLLLLFLAPLPAGVVSLVTMPMKLMVSSVVEELLYWLAFPIARDGVMLHIGPYQLLVADACAGLQTLFSLEALGLLYLNIIKRQSLLRNVVMGLLIIPISLSANVLRVLILVLVTYFWGDAAGQGYLHDFAGIVLFVSALLLIVLVDSAVQGVERLWRLKHAG